MDSLDAPLNDFGRWVVERSYDPGLAYARGVLDGRWRDATSRGLHDRLAALAADEQQAVVELTKRALVTCLHDLLHDVSHDEGRVTVWFEGQNMGATSDGLHGDLFAWLPAFSCDPPADGE